MLTLQRRLRIFYGVPSIVWLALAATGVVGYLVGHRASPSGPAAPSATEATRAFTVGSLLLEVPADWRRAGAPSLPGLSAPAPLTITPEGRGAQAGLLAVKLSAPGAAPLPTSLVRSMSRLPRTQIIDFLGGQAYRYADVAIVGYAPRVDLYAIPDPGSGPSLLACYATGGAAAAALARCEQIVAKVTLTGQSQYELTPDTRYAAKLGALVRSLDAARGGLRASMHASRTPAAVGVLAGRLAAHLALAVTRLSALEAPPVAARAQAALAQAGVSARDAYTALGTAASANDVEAYDAQLARVEAADGAIDGALASFALLGYGEA